MRAFSKSIFLVLLSSATWAVWTILIDLVDASGKVNFVSYMTITAVGTIMLTNARVEELSR